MEEMETVQNFITCLKATRNKNDRFYLIHRVSFGNKTTWETGGLILYLVSRHKV